MRRIQPPDRGALDPARLVEGGRGPGSCVRAYARWTRPAEAESVAAWYRLSAELGREQDPRRGMRPRVGIMGGLMIVSLGVWLLARSDADLREPSWPAGAGGAIAGQGGAGGRSGASGTPGVAFSL